MCWCENCRVNMALFFLSLSHPHKKRKRAGQTRKKTILLFVVGAVVAGAAGAAFVAFVAAFSAFAAFVASILRPMLHLLRKKKKNSASVALTLAAFCCFYSGRLGPVLFVSFYSQNSQSTTIDPLVISVLV